MAKNGSKTPLVSITLPLAPDADPKLLEACLGSVAAQTYSPFELLIFVSDGSPDELVDVASRFPKSRVLRGSMSKSAARNLLARASAGEFLLYIDVDMELSPRLLEDCVNRCLGNEARALMVPVREARGTAFWRQCRALERELIVGDPGSEIPVFLHMSTFFEIGGFDESLDPLDDWALALALAERGVGLGRAEEVILMRETTSLRDMFRRKYLRGQMIPALLERYPAAPQTQFSARFVNSYVRNWRLLLRAPLRALGLLVLKLVDMSGLWWGRINRLQQPRGSGALTYLRPDIAKTYEEVRLGDNFNRYKHYAEVRSLTHSIGRARERILEVGSGTGRITKELAAKGYRVFPSDPSEAMLAEYSGGSADTGPVRADGTALPFQDNCFEGVLALRVVWHLASREQMETMLREMARVASDFVVVDIANQERWEHPLIRPLAKIYFALRPGQRTAHQTSTLLSRGDFFTSVERLGLRVDHTTPLDLISPIWLRLVPWAVAHRMFTLLYRIEGALWRVIPPGRFLFRLRTSSTIRSRNLPMITMSPVPRD